jgi:hypothetical protein
LIVIIGRISAAANLFARALDVRHAAGVVFNVKAGVRSFVSLFLSENHNLRVKQWLLCGCSIPKTLSETLHAGKNIPMSDHLPKLSAELELRRKKHKIFSIMALEIAALMHEAYHRDRKTVGALGLDYMTAFAIHANEPCSISKIAKAGMISRQTAERAIEQLEKYGPIEKRGSKYCVKVAYFARSRLQTQRKRLGMCCPGHIHIRASRIGEHCVRRRGHRDEMTEERL